MAVGEEARMMMDTYQRPGRLKRLWDGFSIIFSSRVAMVGLIIVLFWVFVAIFAPILTPYPPWNRTGRHRTRGRGEHYYDRLPRQLSGGEKQRVGTARALASRPDLVICDEPVSALDVSVQAAVINLLLEIQQIYGSSMIFIAHDLSVVRYFSDDIAVMYLGKIVEIGPAETIYAPPYHPYIEALLSAVPIPDPEAEQKEIRLSGNVPSALDPPEGCRFHTRCPRKELLPDKGKICETEPPAWRISQKGHRILCHIPLEELEKIDPVVHKSAA